jgi:hypothetical protein
MIDTPRALTFPGPGAGKLLMPQLELLSLSQIAAIRNRRASRHYSPARDEFRREHERHREWGLRQRHGRRLMHLRMHAAPAGSHGAAGQPASPPPSGSARATLLVATASDGDGRKLASARVVEGAAGREADEVALAAATASVSPGAGIGPAACVNPGASVGRSAPR